MAYLYNNKQLKKLRQKLRSSVTLGERRLWKYLRNKQLYGIKFFRQYGIARYVLDFYCPQYRLCIEINGRSHDESKFEYDKKRQAYIESLDITVLNFTENEAINFTSDVIKTLERFLS